MARPDETDTEPPGEGRQEPQDDSGGLCDRIRSALMVDNEFTEDSLKSIRETSTTVISTAALVLTINLGLVTTSMDVGTLSDVVKCLVAGSSVFLIISIFLGILGPITEVVEMERHEDLDGGFLIRYGLALQVYSFFIGLGLLAGAVIKRLGVV